MGHGASVAFGAAPSASKASTVASWPHSTAAWSTQGCHTVPCEATPFRSRDKADLTWTRYRQTDADGGGCHRFFDFTAPRMSSFWGLVGTVEGTW